MHRDRVIHDSKTSLIALGVVLSISILPGLVKSKPYIKMNFAGDSSGIFEFKKFDGKKRMFEVKQSGEKTKYFLGQIKSVQFDTSLTTLECNHANEQGDYVVVDGAVRTDLVFHKMDKKKAIFFILGEGTKKTKIKLASISYICFNPDITSVDRIEYGSGFNLLGEADEINLGNSYADEIVASSNILNDSIVDQYVDSLGKYIASFSRRTNLEYSFQVVNNDAVNAYTTGGGRIFVNRGLIEVLNTEEELAGVFAHEIGHNVGKHVAKQLSKKLMYAGILAGSGELLNMDHNKWAQALVDVGGVVAFFSLQKFSRDEEREADLLGFYNLYEAEINPYGMVTLFETFSKLAPGKNNLLDDWAASHPNSDERKDNVSREFIYVDVEDMEIEPDRFQWIKDYVSALPPPQLSQPLWVDTIVLGGGHYSYMPIEFDGVKIKNAVLSGAFRASGGTRNDIKFRIIDNVNFINWQNGNKSSDLLNTDKTTIYEIDFTFPKPGKYYAVFDNTYSTFTTKTVVTAIYLKYTQR